MANLRLSNLRELHVPGGLSSHEIFDITALNVHVPKVWSIFFDKEKKPWRELWSFESKWILK